MRPSTPAHSKAVRLAALVSILLASPALAGWGPDGATIKSTTHGIPRVSASQDGGFGAIVAWQEESAPGSGVLRAQHVLPTGDVDPAWAADGVVLCNVAAARAEIGVVPDGLGGAYVWWKEGASLYLTRVSAGGAVATGWPARGRLLGTTSPPAALPSAIADAANGIYVAWPTAPLGADDPMSVYVVHLGPSNGGAGGWPNGVRSAAGGDPVPTLDYWPRLALAPDGGVFVAWATHSLDPQVLPSVYRLRRMTSAGLNAAGWPPAGLDLGAFHGEWLDPDPQTGLVALSHDGQGGVFALIGHLTSNDGFYSFLESRVHRLLGDGAPAPDWPSGGLQVINFGTAIYLDAGPTVSHRVFPDGLGGATVGVAAYFDHATNIDFGATTPDGSWKFASLVSAGVAGHDIVPNHAGGSFVAGFHPQGPSGPYQPYAYLRVTQSLPATAWSDFYEVHPEPVVPWYGDIALAESGDGGALFFWSQVNERFGLFARRFNGSGQVTGVEPGRAAPALALGRMRFLAGEGVRVSLTLPAGEAASLDLYDVTGRRVAATRLTGETGGARETLVPGTARLAAGLYFAKLATATAGARGRVVVTP